MRSLNTISTKLFKCISILPFLTNTIGWAQNKIKNSDKLIGEEWVDSTAPNFSYQRWNVRTLVDHRKILESEKRDLNRYERIMDIQNDGRFPNAYWSLQDYGSSVQVGYPSGIKDTLFHGMGASNMSTIIQAQIPIELAAVNITPQNAGQYLYRIVENAENEIVHWKKPTNFITTKDGKYQYAYLGKFEPGIEKSLTVEVYNTNDFKDRTLCFVNWRKIKKFTFDNIYIQYLRKGSTGFYSGILNSSIANKFTPFIETKNHDYRIRIGDSLVNIGIWNNYETPYHYKVEIWKSSKMVFTDIIQKEVKLPYSTWNIPGTYSVKIAPVLSTLYWLGQTTKQNGRDIVMNQYATSFSFTVLPPLNQKFSFSKTQLITFFIGLALLVFLIRWYIRQTANLKIVQANFQKEKNMLELSSLRNQLNPHFIFNAITSIQNLIIKNDNAAANTYLTKLGKITRNILDTSYQEFISIGEEMKLLTEYLEMEQLRFGFQFAVEKDSNLDKEIEIPAMLLQPLVENSIKHGIGNKKELGVVNVIFSRKLKEIVICIIDNGGNADHFSNPNGYGISLVQKRINIINQTNKNKSIVINFETDVTKTIACITLHQWI